MQWEANFCLWKLYIKFKLDIEDWVGVWGKKQEGEKKYSWQMQGHTQAENTGHGRIEEGE